jgi:hypothetical protein
MGTGLIWLGAFTPFSFTQPDFVRENEDRLRENLVPLCLVGSFGFIAVGPFLGLVIASEERTTKTLLLGFWSGIRAALLVTVPVFMWVYSQTPLPFIWERIVYVVYPLVGFTFSGILLALLTQYGQKPVWVLPGLLLLVLWAPALGFLSSHWVPHDPEASVGYRVANPPQVLHDDEKSPVVNKSPVVKDVKRMAHLWIVRSDIEDCVELKWSTDLPGIRDGKMVLIPGRDIRQGDTDPGLPPRDLLEILVSWEEYRVCEVTMDLHPMVGPMAPWLLTVGALNLTDVKAEFDGKVVELPIEIQPGKHRLVIRVTVKKPRK